MQMGSKTISSFIAGYKSTVTKQINILRNKSGFPVWQRNYYEHIIRGEEDLIRIREYIINNPAKWNEDKNYINQGSD
jgi:REP element-mobilizing transposase RayT